MEGTRIATPSRCAHNRFMKLGLPWPLLLAAVLFGVAGRPAQGSRATAMDLDGLARAADHVVVGEIVDVRGAWDAEYRHIYSTVTIVVSESWKGTASGQTLTVVQPGGTLGDYVTRVAGLATFTPGERAVLFLRGRTPASVVGLGQGKRPLRFDTRLRAWMADPGDRSAAVRINAIDTTNAPPAETPLRLDELRQRVRAILSR